MTVLLDSVNGSPVLAGPPFGGAAPSPISFGTRLCSANVSATTAAPTRSNMKAAAALAAVEAAATQKKQGKKKWR